MKKSRAQRKAAKAKYLRGENRRIAEQVAQRLNPPGRGIGTTFIQEWDRNAKNQTRMSVLYGYGILNPELAVRIEGA